MKPAHLPSLLRTALMGWWNDRALSLGAAISFYTIFSLAPVLLIVVSVAGLFFGREAAQGAIVAEIGGMAGAEPAAAVEAMIAGASDVGTSVIGTTIGIVTFFFLATGAFVELQDDLNIIWKVEPKASGVLALLRTRLLSLALVLSIGFLLLISLVLDAGLTAATGYVEQALPHSGAVVSTLNFALSLVMAILLFALIFKILPDADIAWRDVGTGAVITGVLFALGKLLIGYYLGQSGVASSYGAAASLVTLLLWVYYSSQILLFGAEFTKAYADHRRRI
ncbi:MAG TPA: YihY/virulence factor BrkB family protein [Aurantimonas sp.]|nr:YihY/virulence factor BrkB family protein [Aurantimonas sp.]